MEKVVIVRLGGEIGIKSRPVRRDYEQRVLRAVKERLARGGVEFSEIWRAAGRIYIKSNEPERASELAAMVFGVSSASPGLMTGSSLEDIAAAARLLAAGIGKGSFAVRCRRSGTHPYTSQAAAARVGEAILEVRPDLRVDLDRPDSELNLEIRDDFAIFYSRYVKGPDGFPVGTQDPVVALVDWAFDSALAAWCLMKRGSPIVPAVPQSGEGLERGAIRNLASLSRWVPGGSIRAVAFPSPPDAGPVFHLAVACAYARSKGLPAVSSGLPFPDLRRLRAVLRGIGCQATIFLPLVALDGFTLGEWAKLMGRDLALEPRYPLEFSTDAPGEQEVSEALGSSYELTVSEDGSVSRP